MIGKHRIVASFASSGVARQIQNSKIKINVAVVWLADDGVVGLVCTIKKRVAKLALIQF